MQITCPDCSARYLVKPEAIGANGRKVKCTRCSSTWFQEPQRPEKKANIEVEQEPTETKPIPKGGNLPAINKQKAPLWHKVAFVASVLLAFVMLSYSFGHGVMRAAPWLHGYYSMLGVLDSEGVGMAGVKIEQLKDGDKLKLVFTGQFVNTTQEAKYIPTLRVLILNQNDSELMNVVLESDGEMIEAEGETEFYNVVPGVSPNAARVLLDVGDAISLARR